MLVSELFSKTKRGVSGNFDSVSAELLIKGGYIDQLSAGVYTFLPLGWRVYKKIEEIIREEMIAVGGQEIFMPTLHPRSNWEKTGRWQSMEVLYKVIGGISGDEMALGPTHEEVVTPLAKRFLISYKDLPKYVFQIQNKFRDEARPKSGLLRTREFMMKDLYSFHTDTDDLDRYYEVMKKAYINIFNRCGLESDTVLTYASGGSFSKYSHEFQTICETGEDTIYLCDKCRVAINKEIIKSQHQCPECGNKKLNEKKAIEVGNIFKLKDKFSKSFNLNYVDENNQQKMIQMGCYGIGLGRLMATIVERYHDEKGIVWPVDIAPYDVYLINIGRTKKDANKIYQELLAAGTSVLWDDRDESAGVKLADSDLLGFPERIIVSESTVESGKIELKSRTKSKEELLTLKEYLRRK